VKPSPTYFHDVQVAFGMAAMLLLIALAVCAGWLVDVILPHRNALVTGRPPSYSPPYPGRPAQPPE
jgi:hypothetical protein